ncbi:hypothetical protein GRI97_07825 [Altererythrobacter xixiisoli]|uniref:Mlr4354 like protein n=1 Tax=Croceibacterium xixiisoli TaxID=1476466 RepID=A0A6I4TX43_9SPHN|nr:invasion associated locus B family protein [Croceibacterium xixiisoli]MXO98893.1 hypothetical protein [Croceibacterium xixiisoli]
MIRRLSLAALIAVPLIAVCAPLAAKDSLGVFGQWGAFHDADGPRCYAIAAGGRRGDFAPFASVGTWPGQEVRGQVHFRLSRRTARNTAIRLRVGSQEFPLTGGGGDAWARDGRMDAAIVAAMRSAGRMTISARSADGRNFSDSYSLEGAATAMDAASVGCTGRR